MREKISKKAFFLTEPTVALIDKLAAQSTPKLTPQQLVRWFVEQGIQSWASNQQEKQQ